MDINWIATFVGGVVAPFLVDFLKVDKWSDRKKALLATAVSIIVGTIAAVVDGRVGGVHSWGANVAIVLAQAEVVFKQVYNRFGISDMWRNDILAQMSWWKHTFLGPPPGPIPPGR